LSRMRLRGLFSTTQHISLSHLQLFQQPNEKRLVPARMHAIDGCDSQKRDKMAGLCDDHIFESKYFLPRSFVDSFKDEVKSHAAARRAEKNAPNVAELDGGFVVPEDELDDRCGSNWKAANSKELPPPSKEAFDQTGVFACLCRHGIVEFLIKFVQSAEMCALLFHGLKGTNADSDACHIGPSMLLLPSQLS
jgi:hypothetical protein